MARVAAAVAGDAIELRVWRKLHARLIKRNPDYRGPAYVCDPLLIKSQQINVGDFEDHASFSAYYGVSSFLKKWKGHEVLTERDRESATFDAWLGAEQQCALTNRRLEIECCSGLTPTAFRTIERAQRKIAQILGRCDVDAILTRCRFSSGATYATKRGTRLDEKVTSSLKSVTIGALPLWERFLEIAPGVVYQFQGEVDIVDCDRLVFVEKDAFIKRGINPVPLINGFLGQGFGRTIRARLKAHGVNLDDQSINQRLAFHALADGLATIDLSSASDTMSTGLVKLMLAASDPGWYECLNALRTRYTRIGDRKVLLNKFSAMGCPFTFELESLIFYALCSAQVDSGVVSVYGDDIIVPAESYDAVVSALNWAGFTINGSKSYTSPSRFYESCGRHYFDLEDVTPLYQKDVCRNVSDLVRLHNRIVRFGIRTGHIQRVWSVACYVRKEIKRAFNCEVDYGPVVEHDQWLIDPATMPFDKARLMAVVVPRKRKIIEHGPLTELALCAVKIYDSAYSNTREDGRVCLYDEDVSYVVRRRKISPLRSSPSGPASRWLPY